MNDRAELATAIDRLYDTFSGYHRPPWFLGCECCWSGPGRVAVVGEHAPSGAVRVPSPGGGRPLRALKPDELGDIAAEVPLTAGTLDVLKHYLPRILEIAVGEGFDWPDPEIAFSRLADDESFGSEPWTRWPDDEVRAIRAFLHALWRSRLADDDEGALDSALCGIGTIDPDIDWYLDEWLRFEHPNAGPNLERFLQHNVGRIARGRLANAFWDTDREPAPQNLDRIVAWLGSPSTKAAVAAAADRARSATERDALTECFLRWLS